MTHIDDRIRSALEAEDRELYDELDSDMKVHEMLLGPFQGRMRWLLILTSVLMLAFTIGGFYCGWRFLNAGEVREMMLWATGFGGSMLIVMMMKLWFWLDMQRISVLREIKRVELQVAQLAEKLRA